MHNADEKALKFFAAYKHLKEVLQNALQEREKLNEEMQRTKSSLEATAVIVLK